MNLNIRLVSKKINFFLATGFASGLLPKAPGTWGTLAAIPLYCLLAQLPLVVYCVAVIGLSVLGVFICDIAAKDFSDLDPPCIVWDEFCGFWLTMLWTPLSWPGVLAGFCAFRIFDILKPWPINQIDQKCRGGLGIMLDDIAAAIAAWPLVWVLTFLINTVLQ